MSYGHFRDALRTEVRTGNVTPSPYRARNAITSAPSDFLRTVERRVTDILAVDLLSIPLAEAEFV